MISGWVAVVTPSDHDRNTCLPLCCWGVGALKEFVVEGMPTVLPFHRAVVRDEAFTSEEFLDARDLVQVKYEMVRAVLEEDMPVTVAAAPRKVSVGMRKWPVCYSL